MTNKINQYLTSFKTYFKNARTYHIFVIVILGFLLTNENLGVTALVRALGLGGNTYMSLLHFFTSSAFSLYGITEVVCLIAKKHPFTQRVNGRLLLAGDHTKKPKEAKKQPCVKSQYSKSENVNKPNRFLGHCIGSICLILGKGWKHLKCLQLWMRIRDGIKELDEWRGRDSSRSLVDRMIEDAISVAQMLGESCYICLDAFFFAQKVFDKFRKFSEEFGIKLDAIVRVKNSALAYEPITPEQIAAHTGRGRKPTKGKPVKVCELFATMAHEFIDAKVFIGGVLKEMSYYSVNLYWQGLILQFVLVKMKHPGKDEAKQFILATSDLALSPIDVIQCYGTRFTIENSFKELASMFQAFSYRFWSKAQPRLTRYFKKEQVSVLTQITNEKARELIIKTVERIERYMQCACIAYNLVQFFCFEYWGELDPKEICFYRTYPEEDFLSTGLMKRYICSEFFPDLVNNGSEQIMDLILSRHQASLARKKAKAIAKSDQKLLKS